MGKRPIAGTACLLIILNLGFAQSIDRFSFEIRPTAMLPVGGNADLYDFGGGAAAVASYRLGAGFMLRGTGGYELVASPAEENLTLLSGGGGLGFKHFTADRLGFGLFAEGGAYAATWGDSAGWNFFVRGGAAVDLRLSPGFTLSLGTSYSRYLAPSSPLFEGAGITLGANLALSGFSSAAVKADRFELEPVFPVFYSYYDRNAFGKASIRNEEDGSIRDVRVSFIIKQYMTEPKLCATFPVIQRGRSVEAPILALLSEDVLKLTENTKVAAEVIVDYTFLGKKSQVRLSETVQIRHRNAMTWDDDRRAAAFVSAKDPAVLRYSKFAAGLIREADSIGDLDQNLKIAVGLFEGLRLYGLNYVVDPTTPYKELSENASAVDFLQYPYQTLVYKGGDCDDLSIMFAAILQSVGIDAAFITVPGHIYLAFAVSSDEASARKAFSFPEDLILEGGKVWLPIEITMINDGFSKAWQYGAREWRDNQDDRKILPIPEAWSTYEPVGIPGEDTRIVLPPAEGVVDAYRAAIGLVVDRELGSKIGRLKSDLASSPGDPKLLNSLGVLYARYGKHAEAKAEFERAVKAGSVNALCNLGNLAFLTKDYRTAADYYARSLEAKPNNEIALLGLARSRFELNDYGEANKHFLALGKVAPQLAANYAYVGSERSAGRASAADRSIGKAPWDEE